MTQQSTAQSDQATSADNDNASRRAFLRIAAGALGGTCLALEWSSVVAAAHDAHSGSLAVAQATILTAAELAEVEAITAQIIPSDATPGAREAGIASFVDRALATFFSPLAPTLRGQLTEFRVACKARHPNVASFADLSAEQQIAFLQTIEQTAFFSSMRLLTVIGMFAKPEYGGNRDGVGWKLLGFEDRHIFEPPFGEYDRDYPGFQVQAGAAA